MSIWLLPYHESVFKRYHSDKHFSRVLTYKMAVKINWHRYGMKLRHCHPMYYWHCSIVCRAGWQGCETVVRRLCALSLNSGSRQVCCWAPCALEISVDGGGRRAPSSSGTQQQIWAVSSADLSSGCIASSTASIARCGLLLQTSRRSVVSVSLWRSLCCAEHSSDPRITATQRYTHGCVYVIGRDLSDLTRPSRSSSRSSGHRGTVVDPCKAGE